MLSFILLRDLACSRLSGPRVAEWSCGFESDDGSPTSCDMPMDGDFDWLLRAGSTPSRGTGPSAATEGSVYMYLESSRPRQADDEAM